MDEDPTGGIAIPPGIPAHKRGIHGRCTVPKITRKVRVIRHSDSGSSPNKPDFSVKINA
jgi:hypothetical protein